MNQLDLKQDTQMYREFPIGMLLSLKGEKLFVLGYHEPSSLILTPLDPHDDYNEAVLAAWSYESHIFRVKH